MSAETPQPGYPAGRGLPLGSLDQVGTHLTPGGTVANDLVLLLDQHTGLPYALEVIDGVLFLVAKPSCADISALFTRCDDLAAAAGTCAGLASLGYA